MRLVGEKIEPQETVKDVLINMLNNVKFDATVQPAINHIIKTTTRCNQDIKVSELTADEPIDVKKLKRAYKCFQQQHRFKSLDEFMATADDGKQQLFERIEKIMRESISLDFIEGLKTKNGDTQSSERPIIAKMCEIFDQHQITYKQAGSQQSKDFRNMNGIGLDIEVKKTTGNCVYFNDTLPNEDIYYIIFYTGKKTKTSEIKPQLLFINGKKFVENSPWVKEYEAELTALKDKWARGDGKKQLSGCMSVYPRPTYKADISEWL
jgi:uncharacterized protein YfbU (UPF0304 family)